MMFPKLKLKNPRYLFYVYFDPSFNCILQYCKMKSYFIKLSSNVTLKSSQTPCNKHCKCSRKRQQFK
jgi:hypothetical protein